MASYWYVTTCFFLYCVFSFHLLREPLTAAVTPITQQSLHGSLAVPATVQLSYCSTGAAAALHFMHTHPRNTITAILFFITLQHCCQLHPCLFCIQPQSHQLLCVFLCWSHGHCHCLCVHLAPLQQAPANRVCLDLTVFI